jgi:hypothetical protein
MMLGNLATMRQSVKVEATQFRLKLCAETLHPMLWLTHGILKALILGPPCQTPRTAVAPRREKKFNLNLSIPNNLLLSKCLLSILLLFLQRRHKSLLLRKKGRNGAREQTPKSLRKKVFQRE